MADLRTTRGPFGTVTTADADTMTPAEFLRAFTGRTPADRARDAELAQAWSDHQAAMAKAPRGRAAYWERKAWDDECRAAYAARVAEIRARYAEPERADLEPKELPDGRFQVAA